MNQLFEYEVIILLLIDFTQTNIIIDQLSLKKYKISYLYEDHGSNIILKI